MNTIFALGFITGLVVVLLLDWVDRRIKRVKIIKIRRRIMYKLTIPKGTYIIKVPNEKGEKEDKEKSFLDFVQAILQHSKDQSRMALDEIYLRGKIITEVEIAKPKNPEYIELSDDKYKILRQSLDEMGTPKVVTLQGMGGMPGRKEEVSRWEFIGFPILTKPEICLPFIDTIKNAVKDEPKSAEVPKPVK